MKELNIRQKRINKGWTQGYVGQQVGVTKTAIHDIETGRRKPSYNVLIKLFTLFGVEYNKVFELFAPAEDKTSRPCQDGQQEN